MEGTIGEFTLKIPAQYDLRPLTVVGFILPLSYGASHPLIGRGSCILSAPCPANLSISGAGELHKSDARSEIQHVLSIDLISIAYNAEGGLEVAILSLRSVCGL